MLNGFAAGVLMENLCLCGHKLSWAAGLVWGVLFVCFGWGLFCFIHVAKQKLQEAKEGA